MEPITISIDISNAQKAFTHDTLVYVLAPDDANHGYYGKIANHVRLLNMPNLRRDWLEKLRQNKPLEPTYLVVDFGGGYGGDQWSSLYHVSQLVNVRLLGQVVIEQMKTGQNQI